MGSAPAGAQEVRDALDILLASGRLHPEDDVQVVVIAEGGSTYDMALSATSSTLYRHLDYWYIRYDNEAYGNTDMQRSSATPYAARTATTAEGAGLTEGVRLGKKDIFEIWRAHTPPTSLRCHPDIPSTWRANLRRPNRSRGRSCSWHSRRAPRVGCTILRKRRNTPGWQSSVGSFR